MTDHLDKIRPGSLAAFLRAKRDRLKPEDVGLPRGRRRRTPGLRREELAELAGVGPAWYAAFEQGRDVRPSDQLLRDLTSALRLTPAEARHMFFLAGREPPAYLSREQRAVSSTLKQLLDIQNPFPALIADHRWDWLAWNKAAELFFDVEHIPLGPWLRPNSLWQTFTREGAGEQCALSSAQWEAKAHVMVGRLRATPLAVKESQWFEELVELLMQESADFRRIWNCYEVMDVGERTHIINESLFGPIEVEVVTMLLPEMPNAWMLVYLVDQEIASRMDAMIRDSQSQ